VVTPQHLGTEFTCPTPNCGLRLKLNLFVVSDWPKEVNPLAQADDLLREGGELLDTGEFVAALECFDRGLKVLPKVLPGDYERGEKISLLNLETFALHFNLLDLRTFALLNLETFALHFNLLDLRTFALLRLGRNQETLDTVDYAIENDLARGGDLGNMYLTKGHALTGMGEYEEALNYYQKASAFEFYERESCYWRGYVLQKLGKYEAALDSLQRAQKLDYDEDTHLLISDCYMGLEDHSKREQELRRMLESGSSNPLIFYKLGPLLIWLGEVDEGCQWLQRFIDSAETEHAHLVPQVQQILDMYS
jgi:tetratricopeptide (TPR) repeat protein